MKFQITERITTNVTLARLLSALESQLRLRADSVSSSGNELVAKGVEASFGSINRSDTTEISARPVDDGFIVVADVHYRPSAWFWVIFILTLFTYVFWLIPIAFYLLQKKTVKEAIEDCLRNVKNEIATASTTQQTRPLPLASSDRDTSIADLERLSGLLRAGLVTQQEFEAHKAKVFGTATPQEREESKSETLTTGLDNSDADQLFQTAKQYAKSGHKREAAELLRRVIAQFPNSDAATRARKALDSQPRG